MGMGLAREERLVLIKGSFENNPNKLMTVKEIFHDHDVSIATIRQDIRLLCILDIIYKVESQSKGKDYFWNRSYKLRNG